MAIEEGKLNCKMVIIDTTAYAGNFERELCAYFTGQIEECYVGSEFLKSKDSIKNLEWWEDNIAPQEVMDEMLQRAKVFGSDTDKIYSQHKEHKSSNVPQKIEITGYSFVNSEYTREVVETKNETVV